MADDFDQKINAILNDPATMQKIMSMAQNFTSVNRESADIDNNSLKNNDFAAMQSITKLASQGNIDRQQQNLLTALSPYLSGEKLKKLENAMRAANMTQIVTSLLNTQKRSIGR